MNEKKRLLKNTGLITIGNFGSKLISFLLLPLYTSILKTSEFGQYDFIVAVGLALIPVVTLSMHEAMFRFIIEAGEKKDVFDRVVSNTFLSEILGILIMAIVCVPASFFTNPKLVWYIYIYVFANAFYVLMNNVLRGLGQIKEYAIISSCKNVLQLVFNVIAVAVLRWGMEGLVFALCFSELLACVAIAFYSKIWRHISFRYFSLHRIKHMLIYSIPLIPNALSSQIINISDRIIITGFMGDHFNGVYSVSNKFPNIIDTVYHYFYTAWGESASRVYEKSEDEAKKYYTFLHSLMDNFMFAVIALMVSGMPIMYRVFVRGDYLSGFEYVPALMFSMYFASIAKIYSGIFTAYKNTVSMAISTVIAAAANIIINILFINKFGLYAAAYSTLIANVMLMLIRKRMLKKYVELVIPIKSVIERVLIVVLVILLYDYNNWVKIVSLILICSIYAFYSNKSIVIKIIGFSKTMVVKIIGFAKGLVIKTIKNIGEKIRCFTFRRHTKR